MTDSSSVDPSSSSSTVRRQDNVIGELHKKQNPDTDVCFTHCHLNQVLGSGQIENAYKGVTQGQHSSSVDNYGGLVVADALGCDMYASLSGDNSWSQDSTSACFESTCEMTLKLKPEEWVMASEFVPGQKWQPRGIVKAPDCESSVTLQSEGCEVLATENEDTVDKVPVACPQVLTDNMFISQGLNAMLNEPASEELCDLCQDVVLSSLTVEERQKHITECIENHEKEMERSFAIQRSLEKTCGICMDIVWEKAVISEQRFGILSNCSHVFCLACIRKWRSAKQFENKIVRACPECRVKSDFVTPSRYWVEDKEDKKKLIEEYKLALSKKPCKYFDKGRGECPFNEKCFYLHALPDGRVASPKPAQRRRRPPTAASSQTESNTSHMVLYEILDDWPLNHWEDLIFHLNFFELSLLSTSDEDDDDGEDDFDDSDLSGVL